MTLREIILARIDRTLRRELQSEPDVDAELELKSDEELLAWHDRIQEIPLRRKFRVDAAGE